MIKALKKYIQVEKELIEMEQSSPEVQEYVRKRRLLDAETDPDVITYEVYRMNGGTLLSDCTDLEEWVYRRRISLNKTYKNDDLKDSLWEKFLKEREGV